MGLRTRTMKAIRTLFGSEPPRRPRASVGRLLHQGRLIGSMPGITTGPNSFLRGGLKEWRAKARWMAATNPYAVQAKRALQVNMIGPRGIQLRGNIRKADAARVPQAERRRRVMQALSEARDLSEPSETLLRLLQDQEKDEPRNNALEEWWRQFCRPCNFSLSGEMSFHQCELMSVGSLPSAGGCMVRAVYRRGAKSKLRARLSFELLPMDRLDDDYNFLSDRPGHYWRNGIEFHRATGRRTRFAILTEHPYEHDYRHAVTRKHVLVPADDIAHVYFPEEIGQTREIPWLMPALTTVHAIEKYEESHWARKRAINNLLGFIEEGEAEFPVDGAGEQEDDSDTMEQIEEALQRSAPAMWVRLKQGEKAVPPQFGPDDNQFGEVLRTMLRRFSGALGLSYATVSRDFSDTNWATIRQSVQEDRDAWRVLQSLLIQGLHQWVFEKALYAAVMAGDLPLDLFGDYFTNPERYLAPKWQARSWEWVDPLKELKAKEMGVGMNMDTLAALIGEATGEDLESTLIQRAYEVQLLKALGLPSSTEASKTGRPGEEPPGAEEN